MTYLNCYTLLEKIRILLNEYSTAYVQGTDTTGKYLNSQIVDGINAAQRYIYSILLRRIPYEFEEETTITGVSSVYTLPSDFGVLRYFKDSDGYQIFPIKSNQRRLTSETGSDNRYYRKNNTLVIDKSGITETCTLIYYRKCRELDQGKALGGGSGYIEFASTAKLIDDYYNELKIENITQDWVDTITDYASTDRKATITETGATNDYYGIVSDLPEPFHFLIIPRAIFEITGNFPIAQEKPTTSGYKLFQQQLMETINAYAGESLDTYPEDVWCDYVVDYSYDSIIPGN